MKKNLTVVSALIILLVSLLGFTTVSAASPNISRSYSSSSSIPNGSLVSLVSAKSTSIQLANTGNAQWLVGVAETTSQSLLAVNPSNGKVQVATDGSVNVLVSTVNGNIPVGAPVAVSPFNGVGMKANNGNRIVGTADTSFNSSTAGAVKEQATESNGGSKQLTVGYIKLTISVGTYNSSSLSVQSIQQFVEAFTGHPVSILRIIISMVIAFVAILAIVVLIYASIYGTIISIGRNPLAKSAIFRTLTSVIEW
ncbi:MAG: hypothetical protein WDN66_01405 [Candidatus Saccharibacteria bacterium]